VSWADVPFVPELCRFVPGAVLRGRGQRRRRVRSRRHRRHL